MSVYADTSLLVSYYVSDSNSNAAQAAIHGLSVPLIFTGLHRLEFKNAVSLGVYRTLLTPAKARSAWADVAQDLLAGRLLPCRVNWVPVFRIAAQLSLLHSSTTGCRSLDVLHVAAARKLAATEFWSFDLRQRTLAQTLGFVVKP